MPRSYQWVLQFHCAVRTAIALHATQHSMQHDVEESAAPSAAVYIAVLQHLEYNALAL